MQKKDMSNLVQYLANPKKLFSSPLGEIESNHSHCGKYAKISILQKFPGENHHFS